MTSKLGKTPAAANSAIRSEADLDRATRELCDLFSRGRRLSASDRHRLDALANAVEAYERVHHPIPEPSDAALLEHLLDAKGSTPAQLARATGITGNDITAILDGAREIRAREASRFARYFHVDESVFKQDAGPTIRISIASSTGSGPALIGLFMIRRTSVAHGLQLAANFLNFLTQAPSVLGSGFPLLSGPGRSLQPYQVRCEVAY